MQQQEQQRARSTGQRRAAERNTAAERQRATERRASEQRGAAGQAKQPSSGPAAATRTAKREQLRHERTSLSVEQRARLRQAFPANRDRVSKVRFARRIGGRIPRSVRLFAVPAAVFAIFPYYRDYRYTVEDDTICIVDPGTYEIVDVLDDAVYPPAGRPEMAGLSLSDSDRAFLLGSIPPDFPQTDLQLRLALGGDIPAGIELYEFAPVVLDRIPRLADYRFVLAQDQLVVVDPRTRDIALVLER